MVAITNMRSSGLPTYIRHSMTFAHVYNKIHKMLSYRRETALQGAL